MRTWTQELRVSRELVAGASVVPAMRKRVEQGHYRAVEREEKKNASAVSTGQLPFPSPFDRRLWLLMTTDLGFIALAVGEEVLVDDLQDVPADGLKLLLDLSLVLADKPQLVRLRRAGCAQRGVARIGTISVEKGLAPG